MNTDVDHSNVGLPARMEAGDLTALCEQLGARLIAARHGQRKGAKVPEGCPVGAEIPAAVEASWKRLEPLASALRAATAERDHAPDASSSDDEQTAANDDSDDAWRSLGAWLSGWSQHLDDGAKPSAADARALHARLFPAPEGLRFVAWRPRKQWSAMLPRMSVLDEPEVAAVIDGLGGARLRASLRATHGRFGRAYGFTAAQGDDAGGVSDVRPQFLAAKDALRDYVKKVEGAADPDVPGSTELARWLLGPFTALVAEFAAQPAARPKAPPAQPAAPTK